MDLVIGGAYQGKRNYAVKEYGLSDDQIFTCREDSAPDWNSRCIEHLERYVWYCVSRGIPVKEQPREDAVILCNDIFCGVVPIDPTERAWREETGRLLGRLSRRAEHVTRLFCALPLQLK